MKKIGIAEIGTNSLKLFLANQSKKSGVSPIYEKVIITRIGKGLNKTGNLDKEARNKTLKLIKNFVLLCKKKKAEKISVVGTAAIREAKNSCNFSDEVKNQTGCKLEIISRQEEALLSFLGATSHLPKSNRKYLVIDIGGGSTELSYGSQNRIEFTANIPIGAVKLTENFNKETRRMKEFIRSRLSKALYGLKGKSFTAYGVGGTIATLITVKMGLPKIMHGKIHGKALTITDVKRLDELFKSKTLKELMKIKGLEKARADIIPAGTAILVSIMELLKIKRLTVSTHGVRYGYLIKQCE